MGREIVHRLLIAAQISNSGQPLPPGLTNLSMAESRRQSYCIDHTICFCCEEQPIEVSTQCGCSLWCRSCVNWFVVNRIHLCIQCHCNVVTLNYINGVVVHITHQLEKLNLVNAGVCIYCGANAATVTLDCGCRYACYDCLNRFLLSGPNYICSICYRPVSSLVLGGGQRRLNLVERQLENIGNRRFTRGARVGAPKTRLCQYWIGGNCPFADCRFAHGIQELMPIRHHKFKTEICTNVLLGIDCPFGERCHFRH